MSPRQRRIVAALALANALIILVLVALVGRWPVPLPRLSPSPVRLPQTTTAPRPTPALRTRIHLPPAATPDVCAWQATQMLAQGKLGGAVTLAPNEVLRFKITHPLTSGQALDEAAQSVWAAFDVALFLQEMGGCASRRVEVVVVVPRDRGEAQIHASADMADLLAFSAGELSEEEFIDRVTYTTSRAP